MPLNLDRVKVGHRSSKHYSPLTPRFESVPCRKQCEKRTGINLYCDYQNITGHYHNFFTDTVTCLVSVA